MADNQIEIQIVLEDGSVAKGFANIEQQAKRAGKNSGDNFGGGFDSGLKVLKGKFLALASFAAATLGGALTFKAAIAEAAAQEQAIQNLNQSLAAAGRFSADASNRFIELANNMQKVTTIADDQALQFFALASSFTRTNEETEKLVSAAVDLSAALGVSVDTAIKSLGGSLSGVSGQLARVVPQIRGLTQEQLKAGAAIDIVAAKFAGIAQGQALTFSGTLIQLKNSFSDFLETIGSFITKNPVILTVFKSISKALQDLTASLDSKDLRKSFVLFTNDLVQFASAINQFLVIPLEIAFNVIKQLFNNARLTIQTGLFAIANAAAKVVSVFAPDSELAQNLNIFADSTGTVLKDFAAEARESLSNIFDTSFSEKSKVFFEQLALDSQQATQRLNESTQSLKNNIVQVNEETKDSFASLRDSINKAYQQGIVNTISAGAQAIGASLVRGSRAFKDFGKQVLGIIGDMAIQIGQTLVAIGIGIDALKASLATLSGGVAIAAGLALIALGGVLKSLSSGSALSGTAGGAVGTGPAPGFEQPGITADEEVERGSQVIVNVEGQILDPVGTATRIAELLAEVTNSNDIAVRT